MNNGQTTDWHDLPFSELNGQINIKIAEMSKQKSSWKWFSQLIQI